MSRNDYRYESPENVKRTNPENYELYEDVKRRHYYGKYRPSEEKIEFPETSPFSLGKKVLDENGNEKFLYDDCDLKGQLKIKLAIKSLLMPSDN